jgi:hypothetical protein
MGATQDSGEGERCRTSLDVSYIRISAERGIERLITVGLVAAGPQGRRLDRRKRLAGTELVVALGRGESVGLVGFGWMGRFGRWSSHAH